MTPIFFGRVLPHGLLVLDRPMDYARLVRSLRGRYVEATLRKRRSQRSMKENRYYWGVVVPLLAEHCGYDKQEMHEVLAMRFLRIEDDALTGAPRRKRTPDTDTAEFEEYLDACRRLAADIGVNIPEPNEVLA